MRFELLCEPTDSTGECDELGVAFLDLSNVWAETEDTFNVTLNCKFSFKPCNLTGSMLINHLNPAVESSERVTVANLDISLGNLNELRDILP